MKNKKNRFSSDKLVKSMSTPRKWFDVVKTGEVPAVYLYDQIGLDFWGDGISPKDFINEIKNIDVDFDLHINSPGGFCYDGFAIYNELVRHKNNITVYIDGVAASMASVIAMAGDKIVICESSDFMIHNPWGVVAGDADTLRKEADGMDVMKQKILNVYAARTNQDIETLSKLMDEETYIDGARAIELGFADELEPAKQMAACHYDELFNSTTRDIAEQKRALEHTLRDAGYSKTEAIAIANRSDSVKIDKKSNIKNKKTTIILR